ncbi:MAG TPA: hypothetical protein VH138_16715 [Vicinamibacterales bacterium]|jgi:hypothetical protein|nr:hypothetical protein [Vicinamibacterales bacterium]
MCRIAVLALTFATVAGAAAPAAVTPTDIEKATGLKGVHLVPATAPGSVPGRDNYADASGKIVLWFQSIPGSMFSRAKAQPAKVMNGMEVEPKLYHAAVASLGEEAFDGPDGRQQHALYVRKGDSAFGLISNLDRAGKPVVSMEQLKALANTILSGMERREVLK